MTETTTYNVRGLWTHELLASFSKSDEAHVYMIDHPGTYIEPEITPHNQQREAWNHE